MKQDITDISDYIRCISKLISKKTDETIVVYRGEGKVYSSHCQPNLFRGNHLKRNEYFEKNLFDEMTANKLTNGGSYLEKAIDAQHGGFPSRLLDVTYNSLVALYFATTPEPDKSENYYDDESGMVYIYFIEKLFCPSGDNINSIYDSIVNRDIKWLSNQSIFQKNHKLIDHIKINNRIIAQQGAFILFQGDMISPIPESDYEKLEIDGKYKNKIRLELKDFFGIHTGSIYPEPNNLVVHMTNKSYKVNSNRFDFSTELDLVISNLDRELEYFSDSIIGGIHDKETDAEVTKKIMSIEEIIYSYKIGIEELKKEFKSNNELTKVEEKIEKIAQIISKYNDIIDEFYETISHHILEKGIEFNTKDLKIGVQGE